MTRASPEHSASGTAAALTAAYMPTPIRAALESKNRVFVVENAGGIVLLRRVAVSLFDP